jgi:hypothetical protein
MIQKNEIVNDDVEAETPRDMEVDKAGNIYVVDTPMFTEEEKVAVKKNLLKE